MTQGLFRLSQLFQQRRQLTPCQNIVGTDRQSILKLTDSCDPFLVRFMVRACWWFHRALHLHLHARGLFSLLSHALNLRSIAPDSHGRYAWKVPQNERASLRLVAMKVRTYDLDIQSKADVRHLLEILLHYLQIDAFLTRAVAAVLAERRCDRQLDWQSHALTCARFASTQLRMLAVVVYTVTGSSDCCGTGVPDY
jgi:hypothetical protein